MSAPVPPSDTDATIPINASTRNDQRPVYIVELPREPRNEQIEAGLTVHVDWPERRVTVCGELDIATVPALAEAMAPLLGLNPGNSTVDLTGVGFIHAAGLNCLIAHSHVRAAIGAKISVVSATPRLRKIFDLLRISDLLEAA